MWKTDKPPLATAIVNFSKSKSDATVICEETKKVVLDGSFLLHLIPWEKSTRYEDTALNYNNIILDFGSVSVVFDGYQKNPTTKGNTHKREVGK